MEQKKITVFGKDDTALVKGVGILLMVTHHCFRSAGIYKGHNLVFTPFTEDFIIKVSDFGKTCVGIFAFLSAYGMTVSLKKIRGNLEISRKEFVEYTFRRLFNLIQGWIFVFLFCEVFCQFYDGRPGKIYGGGIRKVIYFLFDGAGLADLFGTPKLVSTWWYMSFAVIIIVIFPALILMYNKAGVVFSLIVTVFVPRIFEMPYTNFKYWFLPLVLGIIFADKDLFVKLGNYSFVKKPVVDKEVKGILCVLAVAICFYIREYGRVEFLYEFRHGIVPVLIIYVCFELLSPVPYLNTFLRFAGKHSMNIFLMHTFIRAVYFRDFIYGFKYPVLIVGVLFGCSLVLSVIVEEIKDRSHYNRYMARLRDRLIGKISRWES